MHIAEVRRFPVLEKENRKLKQLVVVLNLDSLFVVYYYVYYSSVFSTR